MRIYLRTRYSTSQISTCIINTDTHAVNIIVSINLKKEKMSYELNLFTCSSETELVEKKKKIESKMEYYYSMMFVAIFIYRIVTKHHFLIAKQSKEKEKEKSIVCLGESFFDEWGEG